MLGYAGRFLEVDLSTERIRGITLGERVLRRYVGGRGLATKILWDRLGGRWETVDPLGPENLLLILAGPLTGFFPGGRVCVSGKSPQSNGIVGSTVGGEFGIELRCAGYDGIIVSGRAERPSYLFIADSEAEIRGAGHIWGRDAKETLRVLTREGREELGKRYRRLGEVKEPAVLYIGPAGENRVRVAVVAAKWTHAAGYGGYGAVMGSKNLKAVVAKGTGPLPEVADMGAVRALMDEVSQNCFKKDRMRRWGTGSAGYTVGADTSSEPVRNWQEEWHDERGFGVDRFEGRLWVKRYWGDYGCPTTCLKVAVNRVGPYKGDISDNPDYEIQAYAGTNLGIFTPEGNLHVTALIDDLGLCGIQTGNVLGFAAELYQRGILTREDLGGIDLRWGDPGAFAALARKVALREGIGDLLAEGAYRAAVRIGEMKKTDALRYAVQVKGIAVGAHGVRSGEDYVEDIAYACSAQGGDHTSPAKIPLDHENSELTLIFDDSAVCCWFNTWGLPKDLKFRFLNAVTGWNITARQWYGAMARRILHLQRAALLLGGPDFRWDPRVHDDSPPRFYEPLPTGPYAGKAVDRARFEESRKEYYEAVGWDEDGIPKPGALKRLGLAKLSQHLKERLS